MKHTMPEEKKSTKAVLVDRSKLQRAQQRIQQDQTSWVWKQCMHMAKQAYGLKSEEPLPEIGERNGNYICTYVNKETGEYVFINERSLFNNVVRECQQYNKRGFLHVTS